MKQWSFASLSPIPYPITRLSGFVNTFLEMIFPNGENMFSLELTAP